MTMTATTLLRALLIALALIGLLIALTACSTVPDSVRQANQDRIAGVGNIVSDLTRSRDRAPQVSVSVSLPEGTFTIPEGGWELAKIEVREDLNLIGTHALAKSDWQISEHVAITGLRVLAPLAGFLGGAYFNNQALKTTVGGMQAVSQSGFNLASDVSAQGPFIFPVPAE